VERLSTGLTRDRALAGARYMDEDRLLGAYLLFYWPVSYLQARGVLSELPRPPKRVLDLGSGPGPMAFAALDAGAAEAVAADRSPRALDAARALAAAAGEPLATRRWDPAKGDLPAAAAAGGTFDAVILGHVVNELFAGDVEKRTALLEQAAALLAPGGSLVVVEPALRDTSRALLRVRDRLVERGWAIRAPCLFAGACPALRKESDWCHAERPVEPPPLVAAIAKEAGLRREAVKMSYLVVAARDAATATSDPRGLRPRPAGEAPEASTTPRPAGGAREPAPFGRELPAGAASRREPPRVFRIVSEPLPSKGRLRYMACGPEGRLGLALQEKHVGPANAGFEGLLRGDVVAVEGAEPSGEGLKLGPDSKVRVVAKAGERYDPA
jgi:SAM-dependent methyltransferase